MPLTAVGQHGRAAAQQAPPSLAQKSVQFKVGDRVLVDGTKPGTVASFIGAIQFDKGTWASLVLNNQSNGTAAGVSYYQCTANHSLFTKPGKLTLVEKPSRLSKKYFHNLCGYRYMLYGYGQ